MLAEKIRSEGVRLAVNGDKLVVETAEPLTDQQRTFIRAHKPELSERKCCMWSYLLDPGLLQYTRMGLMTNDIEEARRQLLEIYGKPVTMLHLREEPKEITTRTEDGRILITTEAGSFLWSLGGRCDFIDKGQGGFESFPDLEQARAWVEQRKEEQ